MNNTPAYPDLKIQIEHENKFLVFEAEWRERQWVCEDDRWVINLRPQSAVAGDVALGGHLFNRQAKTLHRKVRDALLHEARQIIKGDHHAYRETEEFDPDDDLGIPPHEPSDLPQDHPSNQPKPGYRPDDK